MTLDISKVGATTPDLICSYDWKDTVRYALSVGASAERDLPYLYEGFDKKGKGPKVMPGYAAAAGTEVFNYLKEVIGGNQEGIVHGGQKVMWHKPFAPTGTLRTVGEVSGVYDLKRMAVVHITSKTWDASDQAVAAEKQPLLFETEWSLIYRFDGGFGGKTPPRAPRIRIPERAADFCAEEKTTLEQALFYRLNGDLNPLHADPELARSVGFERPILHGLCTYGILARVVLRDVCDSVPEKLKSLQGQFRNPVLPGDTLRIEGWDDPEEKGRVLLRVLNVEKPDEPVLSNAYATVDR